MSGGTLYLVPTALGSDDVAALLPERTRAVLFILEYFIVENARTARAFLKAAGDPRPLQGLRMETLDEHTKAADLPRLLAPLEQGKDCGLLSEAGAPAVADPGAALVRAAHAAGVRVVPLVGPSALLLALMACGLNGQRFTFCGYLPVSAGARAQRLREIESASEAHDATQIFIEAPYRNDALLGAVLETCRGDTLLCIATDLTLASESVRTLRVSEWKKGLPALDRRPTVFLLYRERSRQKR